jgi:hypothetical protein
VMLRSFSSARLTLIEFLSFEFIFWVSKSANFST